ncbi:hypothetical protein [Bacteroides faecalis]|nr:hypothetical protein [Bacteroides faecalis]
MKKRFLMIADKMTLPLYCIVIIIAIFIDYILLIPGQLVIRTIAALGVIPIGIANIIKLFNIKYSINNQGKKFKEKLYLNSYSIIEFIFIWYFFFYTFFDLYIYYSPYLYLMLFLGGVHYGLKMANHKLYK